MKKISIILTTLILLIFLTTFNPANFKSNFNFFKIKNIEFENINFINEDILKNFFLENYYNKSLIDFQKPQILEVIKKFDIIDTMEVKKIYPHKLKINIEEKIPVAILIKDRKFFYLTENGKLINYFEHPSLEKLPSIIGGLGNFFEIYKILIKNNFLISGVKSFYYFDIGRWDIILKDGKTLKLPPENFDLSIENFSQINNNENFKNYKIFDYRIKNQLILN